jgi:hypothetical protein
LQPLDPAAVAAEIAAIEPIDGVKTPIGAALEQVAADLSAVTGPKVVILVTDGEETCDGNAAAAIQYLIDSGIDVRVNIVGFALDDEALKEQFREWARLGNGEYFDAADAGALGPAIARALQPPFRVLDAAGNEIARGTVDGEPVSLPPGSYTVEVLADPVAVHSGIIVESGRETEFAVS